MFFFLHDKYISFFSSALFLIGGMVCLLFAPHIVDAFIWKFVIYLSIPIFIYHIINLPFLIENITNIDIFQFIFIVIPVIIVSLLFALLEDYLVPEEFSNKKICDKLFQYTILILFLYILNYKNLFLKIKITNKNKLILNVFTLSWLGNILCGLYILTSYNTN